MKHKKSRLHDVWRQLKKNKLAIVALVVLLMLFLLAIIGPYIAPYDYAEQNAKETYAGSSFEHLLGTDKLGRDVLSRLIYGARQSLEMGVVAVAIAAAIGITIGAIAGFYGRWVDNLCMRLLDIYQAMPMFLLCITLAAILGPSLKNAIIALGIGTVPGYARLMRASVLTVREKEYIEAARAINAKDRRIILKHIVPKRNGSVDCRNYYGCRFVYTRGFRAELYRAWRTAAHSRMGIYDSRGAQCYA